MTFRKGAHTAPIVDLPVVHRSFGATCFLNVYHLGITHLWVSYCRDFHEVVHVESVWTLFENYVWHSPEMQLQRKERAANLFQLEFKISDGKTMIFLQ
jgi:hypothetical protein